MLNWEMPGSWPKPDFILPARSPRGELRGKRENTLAIFISPQNQLTVPGGGNSSLPLTSHLPAWHLASSQGAKETHFPVPAGPAWTATCYILWKVKKLCLNTTTSRWWLPRELAGRRSDFSGYFFVLYLGWMFFQTNQMGVFPSWRNKAVIYLKKNW